MARQDFDLQLIRYAERGWRANFYPSGIAHSVVKDGTWITTGAFETLAACKARVREEIALQPARTEGEMTTTVRWPTRPSAGAYNQPMSDDTQRDNQFDIARQKATQKGFAPGSGVGRAIQTQLGGSVPTCAAPACTNPGGAFTCERGGQIYEFCSEGCRAKFENAAA
jgi:hypothetical protein